jgi:hypothetical protein
MENTLIKIKLDKLEKYGILSIYGHRNKRASRLDGQAIFNFHFNNFQYIITTIIRSYLILDVYSFKVIARYKTSIFSRLQ